MAEKLLEVNGLKKYFDTKKGKLHAVDDIYFNINKGETLGLVGESGCGKSTTGRLVLRLVPRTDGEIIFDGEDIRNLDGKGMQKFRRDAQIVFQDPFSSLNPRMNVKSILSEPFEIHGISDNKKNRISELMDTVGLSSRLLNAYPHELDGGRRHRGGSSRA